ncbi:MAG: DNA methyltransferase, partial [Promethearchaeota archaeon]
MFPDELPYRIIRMFSLIGDRVLDPFVGSGTCLKVAKSLFRKGIGYELNEDFKPIIENKISTSQIGDFKDYQYLLYTIYKKSQNYGFKISFEKQKQKGIIILENLEGQEIVIDYLLIDEERFDEKFYDNEIKVKLDENTIQNYLNSTPNWERFRNYVIVINSKFPNNKKIQNVGKKISNHKKKIQFRMFEEIIDDNFNILDLFI